MKASLQYGIIFALITLSSACTVGPDFVPPRSPAVSTYGTDDVKQSILYGHEENRKWWDAFHSKKLESVVQFGLQNNYDLAAALETLEQAKEQVKATAGTLWPQLTLNGNAGRQKYGVALFGPSNLTIPPFTYYEIGPTVNFSPDIFGGTRRTIEKQRALMLNQLEVRNATFLSLTGNIASTVLIIATLNEKISAAKDIISEDQKNLSLVEQAFHLGSATQTDVLSAKNQVENDETLLPPLHQQLLVANDMLAVLMGKTPTNWRSPSFKLNDFVLPKKILLTVPSKLVHKRPDILAAEATLRAANADVGIATANLYPSINLSGNFTQEALSPNNLFRASASAWSMLGSVTAPIFNGGTLRAERRAAVHAYKASYANYQNVVIKAFSQVNDVLHALNNDEKMLTLQKRSLATAAANLRLARISYRVGNVGVLQVLDTERSYMQAKLNYVDVEGKLYQDVVQLYLAVGG